MHTGREAFLTEKCTSIPTAHKYFELETPKEVVTLSKQESTSRCGLVLSEITTFIPSARLLSSIHVETVMSLLISPYEY